MKFIQHLFFNVNVRRTGNPAASLMHVQACARQAERHYRLHGASAK